MTRVSAYKQTNVATASGPQIMVVLFQAARGHMRASASALEAGDLKRGSELAEKAANIVLGLQGTLNKDVAPELCQRLDEIYTFVACRLGMAGAKFCAENVREAERVFAPVAEAFVEVGNQASQGSTPVAR